MDETAIVVRLVCSHVPCPIDRASMAAVNSSWFAGVTHVEAEPPHGLPPLLYVPRGIPPAFCCVVCRGRHRIAIHQDLADARHFGSHDGGWLLVALNHVHGHLLEIWRRNDQLPLPDDMRLENPYTRRQVVYQVIIQAATLSSAPLVDDSVAAALVNPANEFFNYRRLMLWRVHEDVQGVGSAGVAFAAEDLVDLIYYSGAFFFLSRGGELLIIGPDQLQPGATALQGHPHRLHVQIDHQFDPELDIDAQYLLESRGDLLMVTRLWDGSGTAQFVVFRLEWLPGDNPVYSWTVQNLDGRIIFVSPGCSRAYEIEDLPGEEEGIYFKDDSMYMEEMDNLDPEDREYFTKDAGVCKAPIDGDIEHLFDLPRHQAGDLIHSASVWVLPRLH